MEKIEFLKINIKYLALFGISFLVIMMLVFTGIRKKNAVYTTIYLGIVAIISALLYKYFSFVFYPYLLFYIIIPSVLLGVLLSQVGKEKPVEIGKDIELETTKGEVVARNVFAHTAIFAASRHGKTASLVYPYAKFFADNDFAGVYYDYKNGELYEVIRPLFPDNHVTFAIHRPDITTRINVINPDILKDEKDVNSIVHILLDNLLDLNSQSDFFVKSASSLLSGIILKFSLDHPNLCYLPHVCAFIQAVDFSLKVEEGKGLKEDAYDTFAGLKKFLTSNDRVKMQASSFIMGLASERQTAGVISSLTNALREVSYPDAFWALSGNDLDFNINADGNRKVVAIVNEPKNEAALNPLLATVIHSLTREMMQRNRKSSFLMMDEGVTLKIKNLSRLVATMASFKMAVVYCVQDKKQGESLYGDTKFKEIIANFSTLFFGRANESDTAKYYESYFEPKKIKTRSRSSGRGGTSTTVSEKEVPKYRAHEFTNLTTGKFAMINNGKSNMYQFKLLPNIKTEPLPDYDDALKFIVLQNYNKILKQVNDFALELGLKE
ncbi:type IV secretory system conjugative DNA transfer family protein [Elizabethkingia meningoseptica]|uniref:type IV secretory system conjugative DNA transfer family protein n=1 Tax=Elizabethkingia meningoseptica TaxID=238 RepID=UPI0023AE9481|nr:type IV secretory system conjugative DNA transfer family protein [Elizabethkingia meningoseptica]MDE5510648.1 type IV secretory system conjugative DNA transfer family protein [Elizabethkingia meningoseptica]